MLGQIVSNFDPLRAVREELAGLAEIEATMGRREMVEEERIADAEAQLNAIRKLRGYARIEIARKREELRRFEEAAKATEQP